MRNVYVFKLEVTYPEGSQVPGWQPSEWPLRLQGLPLQMRLRQYFARDKFRWPRERMWLSSHSAYYRAWLLRRYGATVVVRRSLPVRWEPEPWTGSGGPLGPTEIA